MRAVVQRVYNAKLTVEGKEVSSIGKGLVVFLGFKQGESYDKVDWLTNKICGLRIFEDENQKMNLSVREVGGGILLVSNFTLYGECYNGFRPSFIEAMRPEEAEQLYNNFLNNLKEKFTQTCSGVFGADMKIEQVNDGPITIFIDTDFIEEYKRR